MFAKIGSATALVMAASLMPALSQAQPSVSSYPNKPVRILVGYPAGGPTDLTARLIAAKLQASMGQSFIVDNKPGAGSNVASEMLAQSPADGYTLMIAASQLTWNSVLYKNIRYDALKSFEPISRLMSAPAVLAINPKVQVKTVSELVAKAKKEPGKYTFASSGPGSVPHIAGELFKSKASIDLLHVPYKGSGPAVTAVLGGETDMYFMTVLSAMPYFKSGKLLPLGVTSNRRIPQLPNVPTMAEAGVQGVELDSWNGLFAPAGTPKEIVEKLGREVRKILEQPDVRKSFEEQGATVVGSTPEEFSAYLKKEVTQGTAFARSIKLSLD
ncbi:tripartite tricarboxylate transporter substrate binding protein [Cupriavidus sp. BIS7]|uniref:Bug family tripartite tricarboxylate transporter substrate binding protein n=1 Tax=Cupriavidus sp. BIS7 TaxID=1217718 RepID=UPI0003602645|nr:tripartite tricarboxylate transporter substrate binding protein [Cupriavidus sp. BIS7]